MRKILIIDGYNAINKMPEKRNLSLEASRIALIKTVKTFLSRKKVFNKACVVFDSKDRVLGSSKESYGNIDIIFASVDKDADRVIVDILRSAKPSDTITVASDDNFVKNHAKVFSCSLMSIAQLKDIIILKKKRPGSKINEKELECKDLSNINQELKSHWGLE